MTKPESTSSTVPIVRRRQGTTDEPTVPVLLTVPDLREPVPAKTAIVAGPDENAAAAVASVDQSPATPAAEAPATGFSSTLDETPGDGEVRMDVPRTEFGIAPPRNKIGIGDAVESPSAGETVSPEAEDLETSVDSPTTGWSHDGLNDEWKRNLGTVGTIAAAIVACTLVARALKQPTPSREQHLVADTSSAVLNDQGIRVVGSVANQPTSSPQVAANPQAAANPQLIINPAVATSVERPLNGVQPVPPVEQPVDIRAIPRAATHHDERAVAPINPFNTTMTEPRADGVNPFSETAANLGAGAEDMMARVRAQTSQGMNQLSSQLDQSTAAAKNMAAAAAQKASELGAQMQERVARSVESMQGVVPPGVVPAGAGPVGSAPTSPVTSPINAESFKQFVQERSRQMAAPLQPQMVPAERPAVRGISEAEFWSRASGKPVANTIPSVLAPTNTQPGTVVAESAVPQTQQRIAPLTTPRAPQTVPTDPNSRYRVPTNFAQQNPATGGAAASGQPGTPNGGLLTPEQMQELVQQNPQLGSYPGTPRNEFPTLEQMQRLLQQRKMDRLNVAQVPEDQPGQTTVSPDSSSPGSGVLR